VEAAAGIEPAYKVLQRYPGRPSGPWSRVCAGQSVATVRSVRCMMITPPEFVIIRVIKEGS
jgi:hypothetical protein